MKHLREMNDNAMTGGGGGEPKVVFITDDRDNRSKAQASGIESYSSKNSRY